MRDCPRTERATIIVAEDQIVVLEYKAQLNPLGEDFLSQSLKYANGRRWKCYRSPNRWLDSGKVLAGIYSSSNIA